MSSLKLGLLSYPIQRVDGVAGFLAGLRRWIAQGVSQGAELLVLPEYASVAAACGDSPDLDGELHRARQAAPALLAGMRDAARRHRVWLQPGTLVMEGPDGGAHNRAPLIDPDGRVAFQDKHVMTRFEREEWDIAPGAPPAVFQTPWGRIGIAICYDLEFPSLVRAQVDAGAALVLSPSCTDTLHGFNRVRLAARARALENQCYVAIAPTVGDAAWAATLDTNRGYAAAYGPVDRGFPEDGVLARSQADTPGWLVVDLDFAALDRVRREGGVLNHRDWPPAPPPCPILRPE